MVRFYLEKVISQFTPVYGLYRPYQAIKQYNHDRIEVDMILI